MLGKAQVMESTGFIKEKGVGSPKIGIVLGTGLGSFVDEINILKVLPYKDIIHFPSATVEFHEGKLVFGKIGETEIIALQGRFHYYEDYSMEEVVFPIRVLDALGIEKLIITNAAGNMNLEWQKGELMLIDDHINRYECSL